MRFLVDEDLSRAAAEALRDHGHDVLEVRDSPMRGAQDAAIARYARDENRCLVTSDLGFADIRTYPPKDYCGIVVLRLGRNASSTDIVQLLTTFLDRPKLLEDTRGKLAIVEPGRVRLRR